MGSVLETSGGGVLEVDECFGDASVHGCIDISWFVVVPFESEAATVLSCPVFCHFIVFRKGVSEMVAIGSADMLDSEIIDCKAEDDRIGFVFEESRGDSGLVVSVLVQSWDESLIGDSACMW